MTQPCQKDEVISVMRENVAAISARMDRLPIMEKKLDSLVNYKWKIMGGAGAIGTVLVFLVQVCIRKF